MHATVAAVSRSNSHSFSKQNQTSIRLIEGLGVEDDAHQGVTVKHLSRVARDPTQPNLRQVHLIHAELYAELADAGFEVRTTTSCREAPASSLAAQYLRPSESI